jgi:hypothetical protein
MSSGFVIEWEKPGFCADHEHWLARIIEPHVTGNFASVVHMRIDGKWRVLWYAAGDSGKTKSFEVSSREKGFLWVEKWAAKHGASLRSQDHPGYGSFSTYERREL